MPNTLTISEKNDQTLTGKRITDIQPADPESDVDDSEHEADARQVSIRISQGCRKYLAAIIYELNRRLEERGSSKRFDQTSAIELAVLMDFKEWKWSQDKLKQQPSGLLTS